MAWTQDYGSNLWPNGDSEFSMPVGGDPASIEWIGISNLDHFFGSYSRVVTDPIGSPNGYTDIALGNVIQTTNLFNNEAMNEWFFFRAVVKLVSGLKAQLVVISSDLQGNPLYTKTTDLISFNTWNELVVAYDGYLAAPVQAMRKATFYLRVWNSGSVEGRAYFDGIVVRRMQRGVPTGTILPWATDVAVPAGFLACEGGTIKHSDYPCLSDWLGARWGSVVGDLYRLPDLRGRTIVGVGQGAGLSNRVIAQVGGEETHQLTQAEVPSHSHTMGVNGLDSTTCVTGVMRFPNFTADGYGSGSKKVTDNAGGGGAHNNMQPFAVVRYIIAI